jgi:capsular polysaccharide biosynthesis protein
VGRGNIKNREEAVISLHRMFYILWKNSVFIFVIAAICASMGFAAAAFLISPVYSASADLIVNNKQTEASRTGDVTFSDLSASSTLVGTYSVILKSHTILEQLMTDLDLDYTYEELARMVSVSTIDSTQVMRITVRCGDADTALRIVSGLAKIAPRVITDKVEVGSVRTVDDPWTSGRIVFPDKKRYAVVGFMTGFLSMFLIYLFRALSNNTYKTEADVAKDLGLPILGVIPLEEEGVVGRARQ